MGAFFSFAAALVCGVLAVRRVSLERDGLGAVAAVALGVAVSAALLLTTVVWLLALGSAASGSAGFQ